MQYLWWETSQQKAKWVGPHHPQLLLLGLGVRTKIEPLDPTPIPPKSFTVEQVLLLCLCTMPEVVKVSPGPVAKQRIKQCWVNRRDRTTSKIEKWWPRLDELDYKKKTRLFAPQREQQQQEEARAVMTWETMSQFSFSTKFLNPWLKQWINRHARLLRIKLAATRPFQIAPTCQSWEATSERMFLRTSPGFFNHGLYIYIYIYMCLYTLCTVITSYITHNQEFEPWEFPEQRRKQTTGPIRIESIASSPQPFRLGQCFLRGCFGPFLVLRKAQLKVTEESRIWCSQLPTSHKIVMVTNLPLSKTNQPAYTPNSVYAGHSELMPCNCKWVGNAHTHFFCRPPKWLLCMCT